MRQSIAEALIKINEGRIDLNAYAGISCATCMHNECHTFEEPCNSCSSVTKDDGRDFRTATRHRWTPNFEAQSKTIEEFHERYPKNDMDFLLEHPPKRCINPRCDHGHLPILDRGLCRHCHKILQEAVESHRDRAIDLLLLAGMSESNFEYECYIVAYKQLYTWHRFILLGLALPHPDDHGENIRSLGLDKYYDAVKRNNGGDPKRRQLYRRSVYKEQVEYLAKIVNFKD